jgi:hypothetical protein
MPATKEQTNEHPVIFSGWSIRRILAAEKSQTRRIVKPEPPDDVRSVMRDDMGGDWIGTVGSRNDPILWNEKCPYGQPGDVLWVREAFRLPVAMDHLSPSEYIAETSDAVGAGAPICRYEADGAFFREPELEMAYEPDAWGRKRPSIFMPRNLCRLQLRVEDVRVERLQEISTRDAEAEGCRWVDEDDDFGIPSNPINRFAEKWRDIHGTGAWEENPHVWVVAFSKIDTE